MLRDSRALNAVRVAGMQKQGRAAPLERHPHEGSTATPALEAELLAQGLVGHEDDVAVVQGRGAAAGLGAVQGRDGAGERVAGVRGGARPLGAPAALRHDVPGVVLHPCAGVLAMVHTPAQRSCLSSFLL